MQFSKLVQLCPTGPLKPELFASKIKRAFFWDTQQVLPEPELFKTKLICYIVCDQQEFIFQGFIQSELRACKKKHLKKVVQNCSLAYKTMYQIQSDNEWSSCQPLLSSPVHINLLQSVILTINLRLIFNIWVFVLFQRGCSAIRGCGCDESLIHLTCFNSFAVPSPSLNRVTEW